MSRKALKSMNIKLSVSGSKVKKSLPSVLNVCMMTFKSSTTIFVFKFKEHNLI